MTHVATCLFVTLGLTNSIENDAMIHITLNGEEYALPNSVSITGLLSRLELPRSKVAVERNLEIVPKSAFDEVLVEDGDRLEIVHFIGGG